MTPILSILIPTIRKRREMCRKLVDELNRQIDECREFVDIIVSPEDDGEVSIGDKRNDLVLESTGLYIAFIDDDDWVSSDYISKVVHGCKQGLDCCSFTGQITKDGGPPEIFEHSTKYNAWKTNEQAVYPAVKYERYPNHLNAIRREIALKVQFPSISHGEDHDWSRQIFERRLIKSEYFIEGVIYYYNYLSVK